MIKMKNLLFLITLLIGCLFYVHHYQPSIPVDEYCGCGDHFWEDDWIHSMDQAYWILEKGDKETDKVMIEDNDEMFCMWVDQPFEPEEPTCSWEDEPTPEPTCSWDIPEPTCSWEDEPTPEPTCSWEDEPTPEPTFELTCGWEEEPSYTIVEPSLWERCRRTWFQLLNRGYDYYEIDVDRELEELTPNPEWEERCDYYEIDIGYPEWEERCDHYCLEG